MKSDRLCLFNTGLGIRERTSMIRATAAALAVPLLLWSATAVIAQTGARFESAALFNNDADYYEFPPRPARVFVEERPADEGRTLLVYRYGTESDWDGFKPFATNYLALVDSTGQALWTNQTLPFVFDFIRTEDGGAYVLGNTAYVSSVAANQKALVSTNYFSSRGIPTEGSGSAYIARVSPSGQLESVRFFGNSKFLAGTSLARDGAGHLYVAGYFIPGGTNTPRIGSISLPPTPIITPSIFLAKMDISGEAQWVRVGQGTAAYPAFNVRVWPPVRVKASKTGYAVLTGGGMFEISFAFGDGVLDPTGGVVTFDPDGKLLTSLALASARGAIADDGSFAVAGNSPTGELSVEKRDLKGDLLWSRSGRLSSGHASFTSVDFDSAGNVIASGSFGTAWVVNCPCEAAVLSFDTGELRSIAYEELFFLKYTANGELKWSLQTQGQDQRLSAEIWPFSNPFRLSITRGQPVIHDDGAIGLAGVLTGTVQMGGTVLEGGDLSLHDDGSGLFVARIAELTSAPIALAVHRTGQLISLRWPASAAGVVLESAQSVEGSVWKPVREPTSSAGDFLEATIATEDAAIYFRLRKP